MKGSCYCGLVSFEVTPPFKAFQYCHCNRCQKITGSAHAASLFINPAQLSWLSGADNLGRYEESQAKYFATAFCKSCGSFMPWLVKGGGNMVVPAGSLDEDPGIKPQQSIYYADRACWYESIDDLPKYDALPVKKRSSE